MESNKKQGTSQPEQIIYFYVKRFFPDALNRNRIYDINNLNRSYEADIFIPSIDIVIEYDGYYWHKDKEESDHQKNKFFDSQGLYTIRIRDAGLPDLPRFNGRILTHATKEAPGLHRQEYITILIHELANHVNDPSLKETLNRFYLSYEQLCSDIPNISTGLFSGEALQNAKDSCLFRFWNYEKNGDLKPEVVPLKKPIRVWVTCPDGKDKLFPVNGVPDRLTCGEICKVCAYQYCPFIYQCDDNCSYLGGLIDSYINGYDVPYLRNIIRGNFFKQKTWDLFCKRAWGQYNDFQIQRFTRLFTDEITRILFGSFDIDLSPFIRETRDVGVMETMFRLYPYTHFKLSPQSFDTDENRRSFYLELIRYIVFNSPIFNVYVNNLSGTYSKGFGNQLLAFFNEPQVKWHLKSIGGTVSFDVKRSVTEIPKSSE